MLFRQELPSFSRKISWKVDSSRQSFLTGWSSGRSGDSGEQGRFVHGDWSPLLFHLPSLNPRRHGLWPKLKSTLLQNNRRRNRHPASESLHTTLKTKFSLQQCVFINFFNDDHFYIISGWRNSVKNCRNSSWRQRHFCHRDVDGRLSGTC